MAKYGSEERLRIIFLAISAWQLGLMLLDILPKLRIALDLDFPGCVELVEPTKVHWLGEQRHDVLVKGLPCSRISTGERNNE